MLAVRGSQIGGLILYGTVFMFAMTSIIKTDTRVMQKMYFRAIAWIIPVSWLKVSLTMAASIIGGLRLDKNLQKDNDANNWGIKS